VKAENEDLQNALLISSSLYSMQHGTHCSAYSQGLFLLPVGSRELIKTFWFYDDNI